MSSKTGSWISNVNSAGRTCKLRAVVEYSLSSPEGDSSTLKVSAVYCEVDTDSYNPYVNATIAVTGSSTETICSKKLMSGTKMKVWSGKSYPYTRTQSSQSKTVTVTMWTSRSPDNKATATFSVTIPAKTSYAVKYNANGGTGTVSAQTKWYGEDLTPLRSNAYSRSGYSFKRWNTGTTDGGTAYTPSGTYKLNKAVTLYAIWNPIIYFNANGGTGGPSSQTKTYGSALTISSTKPTRTDFAFQGWATSASASSASYQAGGTYPAGSNSTATLYAVWKRSYSDPSVSIKRAYRCDSSGNPDDEGGSAAVEVSFTLFNVGAVINGASNKISKWSVAVTGVGSTETPKSTSYASNGLSGTALFVVGSDMKSDNAYRVSATLTDSYGGDSRKKTAYASLAANFYPLDILAGGDGVLPGSGIAFGMPASEPGMHIGMKPVVMHNSDANSNTWYTARREDTKTGVSFGIGSGGVNHGMWSELLNDWAVYANASTVFVKGVDMAFPSASATDVASAASGYTLSSGSFRRWGKVAMLSLNFTNSAAISVNATGNIGNFTIGTVKSGYRPVFTFPWYTNGDNAGIAFGTIGSDGTISVGAFEGTGAARTIAANSSINVRSVYLLA